MVVLAPGGLIPGQISRIVLMRFSIDFPWTVNFMLWYLLRNPAATVNYDGDSIKSKDSEISKPQVNFFDSPDSVIGVQKI